MTKSSLGRLSPLYFVVFWGYLGYSLFITVFTPLFLSQSSGLFRPDTPVESRVLTLGIALCLYPFGQFISSPILGALSDNLGRRIVLLTTVFLSMVSYFFIGMSLLWENLYFLMGCLLFAGLSEGNLTITQSAISDISTKQERSQLFGFIYVSTACSYLIGPILGGKLANSNTHFFGYPTPFFAVSGFLLLMFLWLYFYFRETLVPSEREKISIFNAITNIKNAFILKRFRFLFSVNFLLYLSIFGFFQNFPIFLVEKFHLGVDELSLFIAWASVPFLIANLWVIKFLAKRFSPEMITAVFALFLGIFLEILLIPQTLNTLWISLFFGGFAAAICLPASSILISFAAEEKEQGRILGINQSLQFFAEAIASFLIGFLASIFIQLSLAFFGMLAFLSALLLLYEKKTHQRS